MWNPTWESKSIAIATVPSFEPRVLEPWPAFFTASLPAGVQFLVFICVRIVLAATVTCGENWKSDRTRTYRCVKYKDRSFNMYRTCGFNISLSCTSQTNQLLPRAPWTAVRSLHARFAMLRSSCHSLHACSRKFAPKCSVCDEPIMPENGQEETVRIVALDRSFHIDCYRCEVSVVGR